MPFIHVHSLPFSPTFNVHSVVEGMSKDFAQEMGVALTQVTATWEFLQPGAYAVAGRTAGTQPFDSHPVLVDLLAPEFNDAATIASMLNAVARSISVRTGMPITNIFINYRQAHSDRVFNAGEVVHW